MGTGVNFNFVECECLSIADQMVQIPTGIWPVAELSTVSVFVNGRTLELNNSAFQSLKLERKAVPVL